MSRPTNTMKCSGLIATLRNHIVLLEMIEASNADPTLCKFNIQIEHDNTIRSSFVIERGDAVHGISVDLWGTASQKDLETMIHQINEKRDK